MRKRNIKCLFDNIFWYLLYLLPVIAYLLSVFRDGSSSASFLSFFENFGVPVLGDVVSNALNGIFASGGVLPLNGANVAIPVLSWFVSLMIIHLAIDFLLFIPRLAHKFMNKIGGDE